MESAIAYFQRFRIDKETGKELWRKAHKLADLPEQPDPNGPSRSSEYGDATPTPVSDGKSVWVFFNTGIVACHDVGSGASRSHAWPCSRHSQAVST